MEEETTVQKHGVGFSEYSYNQMMIDAQGPLSKSKVREKMEALTAFFNDDAEHYYYMLLCREKNDYTLFNLLEHEAATARKAVQELQEVIQNRGKLYDVTVTADGYARELWIKGEEDELPHAYLLFPYDEGVIEV